MEGKNTCEFGIQRGSICLATGLALFRVSVLLTGVFSILHSMAAWLSVAADAQDNVLNPRRLQQQLGLSVSKPDLKIHPEL